MHKSGVFKGNFFCNETQLNGGYEKTFYSNCKSPSKMVGSRKYSIKRKGETRTREKDDEGNEKVDGTVYKENGRREDSKQKKSKQIERKQFKTSFKGAPNEQGWFVYYPTLFKIRKGSKRIGRNFIKDQEREHRVGNYFEFKRNRYDLFEIPSQIFRRLCQENGKKYRRDEKESRKEKGENNEFKGKNRGIGKEELCINGKILDCKRKRPCFGGKERNRIYEEILREQEKILREQEERIARSRKRNEEEIRSSYREHEREMQERNRRHEREMQERHRRHEREMQEFRERHRRHEREMQEIDSEIELIKKRIKLKRKETEYEESETGEESEYEEESETEYEEESEYEEENETDSEYEEERSEEGKISKKH